MSGWVRTATEWFEDPATEDLGADVVVLHLSALAYSAQHTTNGHVPRRALRRLYPVADPDAAVAALVDADWWQPVDGGHQIASWADHILSEDEVHRIREQNRVRSERHRRHERGDHTMCERCWHVRKHGNSVSNGVRDAASDAPRTDPTRPDPKGREGGEGEAGGIASPGGSASLATDPATPPDPGHAVPWAARPGPPFRSSPRTNGELVVNDGQR